MSEEGKKKTRPEVVCFLCKKPAREEDVVYVEHKPWMKPAVKVPVCKKHNVPEGW